MAAPSTSISVQLIPIAQSLYGRLHYNLLPLNCSPYINHLFKLITLQQLRAACLTTWDCFTTYPNHLMTSRIMTTPLTFIALQLTSMACLCHRYSHWACLLDNLCRMPFALQPLTLWLTLITLQLMLINQRPSSCLPTSIHLTNYDCLTTYPYCLTPILLTTASLTLIPLQLTLIAQLPYCCLP